MTLKSINTRIALGVSGQGVWRLTWERTGLENIQMMRERLERDD